MGVVDAAWPAGGHAHAHHGITAVPEPAHRGAARAQVRVGESELRLGRSGARRLRPPPPVELGVRFTACAQLRRLAARVSLVGERRVVLGAGGDVVWILLAVRLVPEVLETTLLLLLPVRRRTNGNPGQSINQSTLNFFYYNGTLLTKRYRLKRFLLKNHNYLNYFFHVVKGSFYSCFLSITL